MLRGVKQGDPLSPLLFNACLDPLLEELQRETTGIKINSDNKVSVLAFADDVILLGKNEKEAQEQINILNKYLGTLYMNVSEEKCQTFQVVTKRNIWLLKNPEIKLNNTKIPFAESRMTPTDIWGQRWDPGAVCAMASSYQN
jgi:hypothetical protein